MRSGPPRQAIRLIKTNGKRLPCVVSCRSLGAAANRIASKYTEESSFFILKELNKLQFCIESIIPARNAPFQFVFSECNRKHLIQCFCSLRIQNTDKYPRDRKKNYS